MINRIITAIRTENDMKRILLSVLAIALCLSLFSGCDQKHAENTSPAEYFQVQKNDHGVIVFSVVAGFPSAKYTYQDADKNEPAEIVLSNANGEINSLLFDLLNGKSTVTDDGSKVFTDCISMTCSYTSDDGSREITVVYEFKWSSAGNTVTICKNNTTVGTVWLSDVEINAFKNSVDHLSNHKISQ